MSRCATTFHTRAAILGGSSASGPPIALAQTKRVLNNAFAVTLEQALEDEGAAQTVNFGTKDTLEAMSAFVEKLQGQLTRGPRTPASRAINGHA